MPDRGATFDWSPDGTKIVFIGGEGGRFASSTWATEDPIPGRRGIGRWLRHHLSLCWRKNDRLILASSQSPASFGHRGTFLLDPKTKRIIRLTRSEGMADCLVAPVSSPDGKQTAAVLAHGEYLRVERICSGW